MKSLTLNYHAALDGIDIQDAAAYFEHKAGFEYIDSLNWPSLFPYKPSCKFKIARSADSLFLHFSVVEHHIRALYTADNDAVWEDSCVEFFCQRPGQKSYYNFELNCIGTCLATEREGRTQNVQPFSLKELATVKRYASLGNEPFDEVNAETEWKLTVQIPFNLIGMEIHNLPKQFKANFYKCADGTSEPHYLSWSPIEIEQPDFHRPDYFGDVTLAD